MYDGSVQRRCLRFRGIDVLRQELGKIRNGVNVGCYFKVSPKGTDVGDVKNSVKPYFALNSEVGADCRGYLVVDGHDHGILRGQII